jgi:hypothetical protein
VAWLFGLVDIAQTRGAALHSHGVLLDTIVRLERRWPASMNDNRPALRARQRSLSSIVRKSANTCSGDNSRRQRK